MLCSTLLYTSQVNRFEDITPDTDFYSGPLSVSPCCNSIGLLCTCATRLSESAADCVVCVYLCVCIHTCECVYACHCVCGTSLSCIHVIVTLTCAHLSHSSPMCETLEQSSDKGQDAGWSSVHPLLLTFCSVPQIT